MKRCVCLLILGAFLAMACVPGSICPAPALSPLENPPPSETPATENSGSDILLPDVTLPGVPKPPCESRTGTVRIASFNIQVFGQAKASNPEIMDILAKTIRDYDVVGIEEIRDSKGTSLPALVDKVNEEGRSYSYIVGERLGRTSSKEQYAFIFNPATVTVSDPTTYPEPAGTDPFHREPYLATVDAREGDFDATLIVIHTDPDYATEEIVALADVIPYAVSRYHDPDVILMGDFNADGSYFDEDSITPLHSYTWIIPDSADTTVSSKSNTYDRIVITDSAKAYYTGEWGVDRFDVTHGLTQSEALEVSDHYPVYAVYLTG